MHPPRQACRELARLNSRYRLAWCGRPPVDEEELNPGNFSIVELVHRLNYGSHDNPARIWEPWDVTIDAENWDGFSAVPMKRANRGVIFTKEGLPGRDWDDDTWVPCLVCDITEDYGLDTEAVFSGRLVAVVRAWMYRTMMQIAREKALNKRKYLESQIEDVAGDATDFWQHAARQSDQRGNAVARKHYRDDLRLWESKQEYLAEKALDDLAPLPPGS